MVQSSELLAVEQPDAWLAAAANTTTLSFVLLIVGQLKPSTSCSPLGGGGRPGTQGADSGSSRLSSVEMELRQPRCGGTERSPLSGGGEKRDITSR